jgi:flagellar motor switch protein FliM
MASPLDSNEVDALMQAIQEGRVSSGPDEGGDGPVVPYDLTSQDRIIRGQMPTLDSINDKVASVFGRSLAGRMRLELRVTAQPATLLKFSDLSTILGGPGAMLVLSLGAGYGMGVLVLEGGLAQALLAGALGDRKSKQGSKQPEEITPPELTTLERIVVKHQLGLFTEAMAVGWSEVLPFKPEVVRFETDPRMMMIANPSDVVILCSFEITGPIDGRLHLGIPYSAVESAKKMLTSPPRLGGQRDGRFTAQLASELHAVKVELRVEMGRHTMRLSQLLSLQIGDVLTLNTSETAPLPVHVQGRPKMTGAPRVVGGGMAIEILRALGAPPQPAGKSGRPNNLLASGS